MWPLALEHDEELVAIVMAVVFVARAGLEHGPADDVIGAGRFLVDQELHLHVDPAVVALQAFDLRHVAQIGAVHFRRGRFSSLILAAVFLTALPSAAPNISAFDVMIVLPGGDRLRAR